MLQVQQLTDNLQAAEAKLVEETNVREVALQERSTELEASAERAKALEEQVCLR